MVRLTGHDFLRGDGVSGPNSSLELSREGSSGERSRSWLSALDGDADVGCDRPCEGDDGEHDPRTLLDSTTSRPGVGGVADVT